MTRRIHKLYLDKAVHLRYLKKKANEFLALADSVIRVVPG